MDKSLDFGQDLNCTDVDQLMKHYYLPVCYAAIFIVGLVGNVTSIAIYATKLRPWRSSSIIMVNLALTDLLYILSLPFLVDYYLNDDSWRLGDFMCRFVRFGFHFNLYGSIHFLMCLAVFRCMVVVRPLLAAQVQRKLWGVVACTAVWVIAAAEIAPMLTFFSLEKRNNKTYCLDFASTIPSEAIRGYAWTLTGLGFVLPLVVVFMCYVGMARKLTTGPQTSSPYRLRARRMTVLILAVFVVCFLPYHVLRVLRIETREADATRCVEARGVHAAYIVSRPLAGFNTFFNLALYTMSGDEFRKALLGTLYWERWLRKACSQLQLAVTSSSGDGDGGITLGAVIPRPESGNVNI